VRLSEDIFRGSLAAAKSLHKKIITVRNKHVAHSEMKMELYTVACDLVEAQNYRKWPNMISSVIAARRAAPKNEKLKELGDHCFTILREVVEPKLLEGMKALREQLLSLPNEQFDRLPDLETARKALDEIW